MWTLFGGTLFFCFCFFPFTQNYFNDDRLLVEKYIVNPHHIEFQVLCSPPAGKNKLGPGEEDDLQVVVFPERECSIQRRNQKVIEESPSVLLTEATRRTMVEQVKRLCKTVGYISAGTVEWLVDEEQNFYFLEMNTRLQVEHPITEAITGVDLVKGMLYIAAGRGLPEEYHDYINRTDPNTVMPHKGHAVEARIYAEDPLRGFLPSTGPLVPYVEPPTADPATSPKAYLRMDAGVAQGHVVTPFYDPMLAKVIYYGPTRTEAILGLAEGLDRYVIEGVQHNARFVNAVLRHDAFLAGRTPTSFLKEHFPDFTGVPLTAPQKEELAVAVAMIGVARDKHLGRQQQNVRDEGSKTNVDLVKIVRLGGMFGAAYRVTLLPGGTKATVQQLASVHSDDVATDGVPRTITMDEPLLYEPEKYLATATLDGVTRALQVSIWY
jgi:propionyl-CoA carboxylase alpha chain